jgi:hypothetical protein
VAILFALLAVFFFVLEDGRATFYAMLVLRSIGAHSTWFFAETLFDFLRRISLATFFLMPIVQAIQTVLVFIFFDLSAAIEAMVVSVTFAALLIMTEGWWTLLFKRSYFAF